MALEHALLVSLLEKPSSGYELARRFDRSIGHFWHATHQQIYRVLARMESDGWIVAEVLAGMTAPDRKEFSVTPHGREEISRWLDQPSEPENPRVALMVKMRALVFDDPARLIPELERHRNEHAKRVADYRAIETRDFLAQPAPLNRRQALHHLVLKSGLRYEQGWLDWCDEALALLRSFDDDATS